VCDLLETTGRVDLHDTTVLDSNGQSFAARRSSAEVFLSNRLDYCNSLLYVVSDNLTSTDDDEAADCPEYSSAYCDSNQEF